jgi:hypothetical protein
MSKSSDYVAAVNTAVDGLDKAVLPTDLKTNTYSNKLHPHILTHLPGMSGLKYRIFANRLLSNLCFSSYLEIGCYKGSTAISAMYENTSHIKSHWLIDDWSDFGGPRSEMLDSWNYFIPQTPCNIIDADCFSFDPIEKGICNVDVYLYDGNHDKEKQYRALTHYYNCFSDTFVLLVDDWFSCGAGEEQKKIGRVCGDEVREGTLEAIKDLDLKLHLKLEMPGSGNTDGTGNPLEWWSGCGIFVLSK